jgi:hypothetical protein
MCIERRNFSDEVFSGQTSADCELDPDEPYTYGQCLDRVTLDPLTGFEGSCGTGIQSKRPNVSIPQIGSGSCPNEEYVDCEVPCPKKCNAPDELWVPDDNAPCMAGTRKLGVPIDIGDGAMVTYCGEGTQIKQLDEGRITSAMMGNMSLQDYKNSINFSECISPTSKPCEVACTNETQPVTCPISSYDPGWLYEGGGDGEVYRKESARSLLRGDINSSQLELEPGVSRQAAIDSGAFNTITGDVDADLIPKGYKIKFKASSEYSTESLRERGCSIFVLEEAQAPRIAADAEYEANLTGACSDVACGQYRERTVTYNITTPAWGTGSTDVPPSHKDDCNETSLPCCVKGNEDHYTGGECSTEGIRTFIQDTGECSIQNLSGGKSLYTKDCCYVGDWEKAGCNLDDKIDHMKYTREIINEEMCGFSDLSKGVNVGDVFSSYTSNKVKYVPNMDDCYSVCAREQVDGVKPPYTQRWAGGGPYGGEPYHSSCSGTIKWKLTKEGKGSGKSDTSCTNYGLQNKKLGDTWTSNRGTVDGRTCPEEYACVHVRSNFSDEPCIPYLNKRDCENRKYGNAQKQCKWVGHT